MGSVKPRSTNSYKEFKALLRNAKYGLESWRLRKMAEDAVTVKDVGGVVITHRPERPKTVKAVVEPPQEAIIPTQEKVNTIDLSHYFFPLFYAGERGPLGLWDKQVGQGHIKRRIEIDGRIKYHVLEIINGRSNMGTFISIPQMPVLALHVTLPHLVLVLKNFRRNFSFEVQIVDHRGFTRRLQFGTWINSISARRLPYLCQVPLRLEMGWNEIHLDLKELCKELFQCKYAETSRMLINSNCRLRQIFFCGDVVANGELPVPSMRIFENMRLMTTEHGSLNHPDYTETGPCRARELAIPDPPIVKIQTRIEKDIDRIHNVRFNELDRDTRLSEPYSIYFKDIIAKQAALELSQSFIDPRSSRSSSDKSLMKLVETLRKEHGEGKVIVSDPSSNGSNVTLPSSSNIRKFTSFNNLKNLNRATLSSLSQFPAIRGKIEEERDEDYGAKEMPFPKGFKGSVTLMQLIKDNQALIGAFGSNDQSECDIIDPPIPSSSTIDA